MKSIKTTTLLQYLFIGLCLTVALMQVCTLPEDVDPKGAAAGSVERLPLPAYEKVIDKFDAADRKLADHAVDELNRYFDEMVQGIDPFLDDIFGLKSKAKMIWYLVTDFEVEFEDLGNVNPWLMSLVINIKSVKRGDSLERFIETKFDRHFGSGLEVKNRMRQIVDTMSRELSFNNGRMAVELGELMPGSLGEADEIVSTGSSEKSGFEDVARKMSVSLISRTSGMQLALESVLWATDAAVANYIAAPLVTLLVDSGIIVLGGVAAGSVTWGAGIAAAIATDIAANKISKSMLQPELEKVLHERRSETLVNFQRVILNRLREYHQSRRQLLERKLQAS